MQSQRALTSQPMDVSNYVSEYLGHVLGIKELLQTVQPNEQVQHTYLLSVYAPCENADENELLLKILTALKITTSKILRYEPEDELSSPFLLDVPLLCLVDEEMSQDLSFMSRFQFFIRTHSLRAMIQNPDLKKEVWGQLQELIRILHQ